MTVIRFLHYSMQMCQTLNFSPSLERKDVLPGERVALEKCLLSALGQTLVRLKA